MEIVDGNDEWSKIDGDFKMTHSLRTGNLDEHGPFTDHLPEKAEFWNWWYYDLMMIKIDWYSFRDGLEKPTSWLYTRIFAWNGVCHWLRSKIKTCDYLGDLPLMLIKLEMSVQLGFFMLGMVPRTSFWVLLSTKEGAINSNNNRW